MDSLPITEKSLPDPFEIGEEDLEEERSENDTQDNLELSVSSQVEGYTIEDDSVLQATEPLSHGKRRDSVDLPQPPTEVDDVEISFELPALIAPNLFLSIPEADPLTVLLAKYVPNPDARPKRDISGDYSQTDLYTLIRMNRWRATAKYARDGLIASDPKDISRILELWSLRLSSLSRLRLYNHTLAETTALFNAISSIHPAEAREYLISNLLSLELRLARAKLRYWAGDHVGYVNLLSEILRRHRFLPGTTRDEDTTASRVQRADDAARVSLVLAAHLVEMKQYSTATQLLESAVSSKTPSPELRCAIAYTYLQAGDLNAATRHLQAVERDASANEASKITNSILQAIFLGEWETAEMLLRHEVSSKSQVDQPASVQKMIYANNLAVVLLNQGKLTEGVQVLEDILKDDVASAVLAEPFLFNLATLYELRSGTAMEKKRQLLIEVARVCGDGLQPLALKLS